MSDNGTYEHVMLLFAGFSLLGFMLTIVWGVVDYRTGGVCNAVHVHHTPYDVLDDGDEDSLMSSDGADGDAEDGDLISSEDGKKLTTAEDGDDRNSSIV